MGNPANASGAVSDGQRQGAGDGLEEAVTVALRLEDAA